MKAQSSLDRLAAARPAILDHTEFVVDAGQEDQILSQIMESARPAGMPSAAGTVDGRAARLRRPRVAIAVAAAVTAAAAGALAGTGVLRGTQGTAPGAPGQAHVVSLTTLTNRTAAASSGASQADILYSRVTYAPGSVVPETAAIEEWHLGLSSREKWFNAQGGLMQDISDVASGGQRAYRAVDYTDRTWQTDTYTVDPSAPPQDSIADLVRDQFEMTNPKPVITRVELNGKPMFQLTWQLPAATSAPVADDGGRGMMPLPMFTYSDDVPGEMYAGAAVETFWIDADTYLPAQAEMTTPAGQLIALQTLTWQTPDAANRAELTTATIPPGFTETAMAGN
jgi:hypothetical protein